MIFDDMQAIVDELAEENDQLRAEIDRLRRMLVGYVNHVSEFEGIDYLDRESEWLTQSERQEIAQMVDAAFNKDAEEGA
jgi:regulator of replication initiation timing